MKHKSIQKQPPLFHDSLITETVLVHGCDAARKTHELHQQQGAVQNEKRLERSMQITLKGKTLHEPNPKTTKPFERFHKHYFLRPKGKEHCKRLRFVAWHVQKILEILWFWQDFAALWYRYLNP